MTPSHDTILDVWDYLGTKDYTMSDDEVNVVAQWIDDDTGQISDDIEFDKIFKIHNHVTDFETRRRDYERETL